MWVTVILLRMRRFLTVLAAAGLSVILSSCAGVAEPAAEPTGSPSPTSTPTIEATPTPDASEVATEIVVAGDRIVVIALDGSELDTANFFTDRDLLVETLTDALGAEPTVTTRPVGNETRAGLIHDWNGLSLFLADGEWGELVADITRLEVTAATVNGIAIRTNEGIQVGTLVSDLDPSIDLEPITDGSILRLGAETVGTGSDLGEGGDSAFLLIASVAAFTDATAVNRMFAPATNWGV